MTSPAKPGGPACATCPAREGRCVVPQEWPQDARPRLAVISGYPNYAERAEGRHGAGHSNRVLGRLLGREGLKAGDVHWTSAVLCECEWEDRAAAAKACARRLREELASVGVEVAVPTDATALQHVLELPKKVDLIKWRGSVTRVEGE